MDHQVVEVIGAVELFEPRWSGWPPIVRAGRRRAAAGQWELVQLTDFGTQRELAAGDETWSQLQALTFLELCSAGWNGSVAPLEVGLIEPPRRNAALPPGNNYVPDGHLEVLERPFLVEEVLMGRALRLLAGAPPPRAVASAVLRALDHWLRQLHRWSGRLHLALRPAHLDVELWLRPTGEVGVRPRFHYLPSVDFAGTRMSQEHDGTFQEVVEGLRRAAEEPASALEPLINALGNERVWPVLKVPEVGAPTSARGVIAQYVSSQLGAQPLDERLSLPEPPEAIRRWLATQIALPNL